MSQIADRFKVLMLDDASRLGAAMISEGGCFWRNGSGGVGIAHNGFCLDLNARQAGQVRAVLPISITRQAARLPDERVPSHLRKLLRLPVEGVRGAREDEEAEPSRSRRTERICA